MQFFMQFDKIWREDKPAATKKKLKIEKTLLKLLTFGSKIFRSKLFWTTFPLWCVWFDASRRKRARSTRANVGLSIIDGVRLGGPEFVSAVTNIFSAFLLFFFTFIFSFKMFSYLLYLFQLDWRKKKTYFLISLFSVQLTNFIRSKNNYF